jgi:hypothetical protein
MDHDSAGAWRPNRALLAAAVVLVIGAAGLLAWVWAEPAQRVPSVVMASAPAAATMPSTAPASAAPTAPAVAPAPPLATAVVPPAAPELRIPRQRDPNGDQTPDLADYVNPGELPTMQQVIERLRANGITGGLAAFSPPGTRPPLVGLAVPEDFQLPPGYVRHYQATDDGQRIEPILMYSPHVAVVADAAGRPVSVPEDRVVPPDAAPAGLPIRRIVVPPPAEPGAPGR